MHTTGPFSRREWLAGGGGQFRPYDTLFIVFIPALKAAGFADTENHQLLIENPRLALTRNRKTS